MVVELSVLALNINFVIINIYFNYSFIFNKKRVKTHFNLRFNITRNFKFFIFLQKLKKRNRRVMADLFGKKIALSNFTRISFADYRIKRF